LSFFRAIEHFLNTVVKLTKLNTVTNTMKVQTTHTMAFQAK